MSSSRAVAKAIIASRKAIEEAIVGCASAGQVASHLMSRPHQISNAMVHDALRVIAMRAMAHDLARVSKKGARLVDQIMVKQGEIAELHDMLRKVANDNRPIGPEVQEVVPKFKVKHHELEDLFNQLYEPDIAEEFGLAGQRPPDLPPVGNRPDIRLPHLDAAPEPGSDVTRLLRKNVRQIESFADVAKLVKGLEVDASGMASLTTDSGGRFKVNKVHLFESADGPVYLFDLDDPQSGRQMRRAVETYQGGERKLYVEYEMLRVPHDGKPVLAHVVHAHHLVTDVAMDAFSVFGQSKTSGYDYGQWWTILLTNGRYGTPHRTVTTLQAGRGAAMRRWAANAKRVFEAAMEFKNEYGQPNGPKLSDFPADLRQHSLKMLLDDAAEDLRKAGVPPNNVKECVDAFRLQFEQRVAPLMKERLVKEHFDAIMEGVR